MQLKAFLLLNTLLNQYICTKFIISRMSQGKKTSKKKKVSTRKDGQTRPTVSRSRALKQESNNFPLIFNRQNYIYMAIGAGLIVLGLLLMMGGGMSDPNVWDENVIYSFRRTVLAPVVILAGLGMEIYAIFK